VVRLFLQEPLRKLLDVPFAIADATTLTEAGYVGDDVENIVSDCSRLPIMMSIVPSAASYMWMRLIKLVEKRIMYPSPVMYLEKESSRHYLKYLEGTVCNIPPQGGRKHPNQEYVQLDTSNILFICGGAFVGLDDIIGQRKGNRSVGYNTETPKEPKRFLQMSCLKTWLNLA
jgi:ATP-dependent Clp protease ATP-binding subunit ClpX